MDDSDTSRRAAAFVHDLFGDTTEILGVDVAERPLQWIAPGIGYGMVFPTIPLLADNGALAVDVDLRDDARRQATQVLIDCGLDHAAPIGAVGDPVAAILTAASEQAVDLIVVGSDEPGFLDRMLDRSYCEGERNCCPAAAVCTGWSDPGDGGPRRLHRQLMRDVSRRRSSTGISRVLLVSEGRSLQNAHQQCCGAI